MKAARYYPDPNLNAATPCYAKERSDGSGNFDLYYNDKSAEPFCTNCPGADAPKLGHVVLDKEAPKKEAPKK